MRITLFFILTLTIQSLIAQTNDSSSKIDSLHRLKSTTTDSIEFYNKKIKALTSKNESIQLLIDKIKMSNIKSDPNSLWAELNQAHVLYTDTRCFNNSGLLFKGDSINVVDYVEDKNHKLWKLVTKSNKIGFIPVSTTDNKPLISFSNKPAQATIQRTFVNDRLDLIKQKEKALAELEKKKEEEKITKNKYKQIEKKSRLTMIYGPTIADKISSGHYWIGMTSAMARESLGSPKKINRTVNAYGTKEQWVYYHSIYLYFENGILTTYQD